MVQGELFTISDVEEVDVGIGVGLDAEFFGEVLLPLEKVAVGRLDGREVSQQLLPFSEEYECAVLKAVTVALVAQDGDGNHCLLCIQREEDPAAGHWSIPGGKAFPNESPALTGVRETEEEVNITLGSEEVDSGRYYAFVYPDSGYYVAVVLLRVDMCDPRISAISAGHKVRDVQWARIDELVRGEACLPQTLLLADLIEHHAAELTSL